MVEEVGSVEVQTSPETFEAVKKSLENQSFVAASAEVAMVPQAMVKIDGREAQSMLKLMEALDDHDDVRQVFANFDIAEEAMLEAAS